MAENDYNAIKPIQGLANVAGVSASKGNQDRKKQSPHQQPEAEPGPLEDEPAKSVEDDLDRETVTEDPDEHMIDFCA